MWSIRSFRAVVQPRVVPVLRYERRQVPEPFGDRGPALSNASGPISDKPAGRAAAGWGLPQSVAEIAGAMTARSSPAPARGRGPRSHGGGLGGAGIEGISANRGLVLVGWQSPDDYPGDSALGDSGLAALFPGMNPRLNQPSHDLICLDLACAEKSSYAVGVVGLFLFVGTVGWPTILLVVRGMATAIALLLLGSVFLDLVPYRGPGRLIVHWLAATLVAGGAATTALSLIVDIGLGVGQAAGEETASSIGLAGTQRGNGSKRSIRSKLKPAR